MSMCETIRIATWNIGSLYADYAQNIKYLQSVLQREHIDVLCMQEVPQQQKFFCDICAWGNFSHYVYHSTSISHVFHNNMGIAVFSRFPVEKIDVFRLTKPTVEIFYKGKREYWHDKYFMAVDCAISDQRALVVTGHGFPFHRYDLENADNYQIIRPPFQELDDWFSGLVIKYGLSLLCAAADFNIQDPMQFMPKSAAQYRDVFLNEATRPSGRKTDTILVHSSTPDGERTNIRPPMKNGQGIFDHNFIMAELQV